MTCLRFGLAAARIPSNQTVPFGRPKQVRLCPLSEWRFQSDSCSFVLVFHGLPKLNRGSAALETDEEDREGDGQAERAVCVTCVSKSTKKRFFF